ncbi:MAG: glutamine synthetase family protein, partial [Spirochaetota bacterium]|nr:glutamine synthetase family protein [Spirochaetota bacterium]
MGKLTLEELNNSIKKEEIDSVILAFPNHLGQIMGKRYTGSYFLENNHANCCDYLLTINIEEDPLPGFKLSSWETGYGDLLMVPDFSTIKKISWQKNTAIIICNLTYEDGRPVNMAPRTMLQNQCNRLADMGMTAMMASELEFYLFDNPYEAVYTQGFKGLAPSSPYPIDYDLLNTGFKDDIIQEICNKVLEAGIPVESSKGETGFGQYEIGLKYSSPIEMADWHMVYKNGVKTIANLNGSSVTFMAKYSDEDAGSSCHIHTSIVDKKSGKNVFVNNGEESEFYRYFLGGLNLLAADLFLFFAPTINSYKRFSNDSFAPTRIAWDYDNRTTSFRVVGEGQGFRIENRLPGADANPYLAFSATIAAGLYGVENKIEPPA